MKFAVTSYLVRNMSKGLYRGKPLEDHSKEELIDLIVDLMVQRMVKPAPQPCYDLVQGADGVWAVNEKD